jgi:L-lysine 2,3-aminomutase
MLDPIAGGAHYDVPIKQAQELINDMQDRVSAYLIPKLVKEEIGTASKTPITNQV